VSVTRRDAAAWSGFRQATASVSEAPFEFAAQGRTLGPGSEQAAIAWRPLAAEAPEMACPSEAKGVGSAQPVAWAQQALSLPPEVPAARYARVVRPWVEAAHAVAARPVPWAASDAGVAQPREAVAAWDAGVALQREAAVAVWDAEAVPQQEVVAAAWDAEAVQQPAGAAVAAWWAQQRAAAHPSAAPWVFRRGPILPFAALAPQRAARSAHAMRRLRAASPSELSWQAARCEVLS
jgi:hypothetical protein